MQISRQKNSNCRRKTNNSSSTQNDELLRNKSKKEKINSRHNISSIHFRNIYKSTKLNKTVAKKQKIGYYMNDISIEILNL